MRVTLRFGTADGAGARLATLFRREAAPPRREDWRSVTDIVRLRGL